MMGEFMYQHNRRFTGFICLSLCVILVSTARYASAKPRCWVGVIDQINPPWVIVSGEYDEEAVISLQQVYTDAEEGDWVIYWTGDQRLEKLTSSQAYQENQRLNKLGKSLVQTIRAYEINK